MSERIFSEDRTAAYSTASKSMFTFTPGRNAPSATAGDESTQPYREPDNATRGIAYWGRSNDFPTTVLDLGAKIPVINTTLQKQADILCGKGLRPYVLNGYDNNDNEILEPVNDQPIKEFMARTNINKYLRSAAYDYYWLGNIFPELILSKNRKKIVAVSAKKAKNCRFREMNEETGKIEKCLISGKWPSYKEQYTTEVPVIDREDPFRWESLREASDFKHIYPVSIPTTNAYYAVAQWDSARKSKWSDLATSIPEFKKFLMDNQYTIKYQIEIADYFWKWKYGQDNWEIMSDDEQIQKKQDTLDEFDEMLRGAENAGKSILTPFRTDTEGKPWPGVKITQIDTQKKDGEYIEDSNEASAQLLYAMGFDPTILGFTTSKGMTAGSGSDKRVAINIYVDQIDPHKYDIAEPFQFTSQYNYMHGDWPEGVVWRIPKTKVTTLDQGETTSTGAPKNPDDNVN